MAFFVYLSHARRSSKNVVLTAGNVFFHVLEDCGSRSSLPSISSISTTRRMFPSLFLKHSKRTPDSIANVPALNWFKRLKVIIFRRQPSTANFLSRSLSLVSKSPLDVNRQIVQDVLVYSHNNDSFYKTLSLFGIFQLSLWGYLAFSIQDLRLPAIKEDNDPPLWKKFLYKEGQYKNALSLLSLIVGASIFFITITYPRRAVKNLWMLKGGQDIQITTYSWLGKENTFKRPIEHIKCLQSRKGAGQHIPLQVKGSSFYFLLDKKGSFHNTDLFDFLIAVKRNIK